MAKGKPAAAKPKKGKVSGSTDDKLAMLTAIQEKSKESAEARAAAAASKKSKRKKKAKAKGKSFWTRVWEKMAGSRQEVQINKKTKEMVAALMITEEEIRALKGVFDEVDLDQAGEMDFDEFFEILEENRTPFTEAIFTLVDDPGQSGIEVLTAEELKHEEQVHGANAVSRVRGHLTFNDFVQSVCTFCMYTKDDILLFAFNAFDSDMSGVIDEKEFIQLCAVVNNNQPTYPENFKQAIESFDKNEDGMMDFDEFKELNDKFPMILFPAFRLQDKMQSKMLGRKAWLDIGKRVQEEREIENYKRTHGGQAPPLSWQDKYLGCFRRKKHGSKRARKPPSARETALKKASQQNPKTSTARQDNAASSNTSSTRREARGAGAVGKIKLKTAEK